MTDTQAAPQKDWINIAFLSLTPLIGIGGTALYTIHAGFEWWMPVMTLVLYFMVGLAITAGYHRFFAHKSYECSRAVQYFYAIFGAMAHQNSILAWSSGHRVHHKHVDTDWDPYNIKRGFWWAHIIWIFYASPYEPARDLAENKVVQWQHRWHNLLGLGVGFGLPTALGWLLGDPIAGLLWGGFLRVVVIHHTTFFVNSLSHTLGSQEFDANVSARDNWMVALMTLGEGYHSFHHRFPADFRNGMRWFHWDPAKWFISTLRMVGLASNLKMTAPPVIEQARIDAGLAQMQARLSAAEPTHREKIQRHLQAAAKYLDDALVLWRRQASERRSGAAAASLSTQRESRVLAKQARREWLQALNALKKISTAA